MSKTPPHAAGLVVRPCLGRGSLHVYVCTDEQEPLCSFDVSTAEDLENLVTMLRTGGEMVFGADRAPAVGVH